MFKFYTTPLEDKDIIDNLIGNKSSIKLSSAFNLNDPFELKFNFDIDPFNDGHKDQYFKSHPSNTQEDFLNWQRHAKEHDGYSWYSEQQQRESIAKAISLCSFTKENNNNLMWSHYTDNHKGICVEYTPELFDYLKSLNNYFAFWKVKYSEEPPIVMGIEKEESKVEKIMFNKQSEWKYEKEYRLVFTSEKTTEFIPINRNYIKSVFIGSRTESTIVNEILETTRNTEIEIYYGITIGNSYKVHYQKHKEGTYFSRAFWK